MKKAFTLLELLVVMGICAILFALSLPVISSARAASSRALSTHSLQQLMAAGNLYLNEHRHTFWKYSQFPVDGGTMWWFGWESNQSRFGTPEGKRTLDLMRGPLGPYAIAADGVRTDPAFLAYSQRLKPKYKDGNYGYGYNSLLPGQNSLRFQKPSSLVVFATCAQINTFQSPASPANPMIEEFYMINDTETTVHFRHGGKALAAFLDGSVREMPMDPTTLDKRLPSAQIGRFAPVGSKLYLNE